MSDYGKDRVRILRSDAPLSVEERRASANLLVTYAKQLDEAIAAYTKATLTAS